MVSSATSPPIPIFSPLVALGGGEARSEARSEAPSEACSLGVGASCESGRADPPGVLVGEDAGDADDCG